MNKDNIYKCRDLQGNEKIVNLDDPKYIIAEFEAIKSLVYENEAVKKIINNLNENKTDYKEEATRGCFIALTEAYNIPRETAEIIVAYFNVIMEQTQFTQMQNGVIMFLNQINKQSDEEFKEFIQGITEARENFKQDIERYVKKQNNN